MDTELILKQLPSYRAHHERYEAWLIVSGQAVGWSSLFYEEKNAPYLCLSDIEIRPEYRSQGYSRKLAHLISVELGKPLGVTGDFTPDGFACLSGRYPILPSIPDAEVPDEAIITPMVFVNDWESFRKLSV